MHLCSLLDKPYLNIEILFNHIFSDSPVCVVAPSLSCRCRTLMATTLLSNNNSDCLCVSGV